MVKNMFIFLLFGMSFSQQIHQTQQVHSHGGAAYATLPTTSALGVKFHAITVGQKVVGSTSSSNYKMDFGIWSFYKNSPDAPIVKASDAGINLGIDITYSMDPLSPPAYVHQVPVGIEYDELGGYPTPNHLLPGIVALTKQQQGTNISTISVNITPGCSGSGCATMTPGEAYSWILDVSPGVMYNFGITVFNSFGISPEGYDVGFSLANGQVSGMVNIEGDLPGSTGAGVVDVEVQMARSDGQSIGNALLLDGADDYLYAESIYDDLLTDNQMTVEFWFKNISNTSKETILDFGSMFSVTQSSNTLTTKINNETLNTTIVDTDNWHHVAFSKGERGACIRSAEACISCEINEPWSSGNTFTDTNNNSFYDPSGVVKNIFLQADCVSDFDNNSVDDAIYSWDPDYYASGLNLYIDGELMAQNPSYNTSLESNNRFVIGKSSNNDEWYSGYIDDLRIWDKARTPEEIHVNKDRFLAGDEDGLIAYWKMNAGMFDKSYNIIQYSEDIINTSWTELVGNNLYIEGTASDNDVIWTNDSPSQHISAFTDINGFYRIKNIAYDSDTYEGTQFNVIPHKENHDFFDPSMRIVFLGLNSYDYADIHFVDNSLFNVSGEAFYQNFQNCTIDSVEVQIMYLGDTQFQSTNPKTFTESGISNHGKYRIDVEPEKTFVIRAVYKDHPFTSTHSFYDISGNKVRDFEDYNLTSMHGIVSGGLCEEETANSINLGQYTVLWNETNDCISGELSASDMDFTIASIPPLEYTVKIIPNNSQAVLSSNILVASLDDYDFPNQPTEVELGQFTNPLSYKHYPPLEVRVVETKKRVFTDLLNGSSGVCNPCDGPGSCGTNLTHDSCDLDASGCTWLGLQFGTGCEPNTEYTHLSTSCDDSYILEQGKDYSTFFNVYENYSYESPCSDLECSTSVTGCATVNGVCEGTVQRASGDCKMVDFNLNIIDNVTGTSIPDMPIKLEENSVEYYYTARKPNIVGTLAATGVEQTGFRQYIEFKASDINTDIGRLETGTKLFAYVNGTLKDANQVNVNSTTSSIPFFVLRDPPGDASYSYLSQSQQICQAVSTSNSSGTSGSASLTAHLGSDISVEIGVSFGAHFAVATDISIIADLGTGITATTSATSTTETTTCFTVDNTYATSDDDNFVGEDGDIFVGSGLSMTFSKAIKQTTSAATGECIVSQEPTYISGVDGLVNTYMHTQSFLENTLIPQLEIQGLMDSKFLADAAYWESLIALNETAKTDAVPANYDVLSNNADFGGTNIDWSSGSIYEFSKTSETSYSSSHEYEHSNETELSSEFGITLNGTGASSSFAVISSSGTGGATTNSKSNTKTIGFVFADDDPGDHFLVQVKEDKTWGMPVFELVGGQSECPWETGTSKRYDPILQVAGSDQIFGTFLDIGDVGALDAAALTFTLNNNSTTLEAKDYMIRLRNDSNPLGALVTYNGQPMTSPFLVSVPAPVETFSSQSSIVPGTSTATVYVRKEAASEEYSYDNLVFEQYPACSEGDPAQTTTATVSVNFEKTCTDISLSTTLFGTENWSIDQSAQNMLDVYITGYEFVNLNTNNVENLDEIYIEYADVNTENWTQFYPPASISIDVLSPPDGAQKMYHTFTVDANLLNDEIGGSDYKIRAVTKCSELNKNYSNILVGTIDREEPQAFQLQPIDNVLSGSDVISITYNEDIDCNYLEHVVISAENTTMSSDFSTAVPILLTSCNDNKISIDIAPATASHTVENDNILIKINSVRDLLGNISVIETSWEFLYNKNPITWSQPSITQEIYLDDNSSISTVLNNVGGGPSSFAFDALDSIPSWLTIDPMSGWLNGQGQTEVTFTLDPNMATGNYQETIYAENNMGLEPIGLNLTILCRPPNWDFDLTNFQNSMTIVTELAVENSVSVDTYDRVVATIDGEYRGYVQLEELGNKKLAYLTVYGDSDDDNKEVKFRLWDNNNTDGQCRELWNIIPSIGGTATEILYHNYESYGSYSDPLTLNAPDLSTAQHIDVNSGWSWLSFNLHNSVDMSASNALDYLSPSAGDQFINFNEGQYITYSENSVWEGTFAYINNQYMYQLNLSNSDQLTFVGLEVNSADNNISYENGWTWIAYTPQSVMGIDNALANLTSVNTNHINLIKGRFGFAEYIDGIGWVGSLTYMYPGQGYMLDANNSGNFTYSNSHLLGRQVNDEEDGVDKAIELHSTVGLNSSLYQYTMSVVTKINANETLLENQSIDDLRVLAYHGDKIKGIANIEFIQPISNELAFLSIYGNSGNEDISIRILNQLTSEEYLTDVEFDFEKDEILGSANNPIILSNIRPAVPDNYSLSQNYPNPFNPTTRIDYQLPVDSQLDIIIYNIAGQEIISLKSEIMSAGYGSVIWSGLDNSGLSVASGIYFVKMQTPSFTMTHKMMLLK